MTFTTRDQIEWLHSLVQELEAQDVELPMGDYPYVYDMLETLREDIPEFQTDVQITAPSTVQNPKLVDITGSQPVVLNVMHANMIINITAEGVIMDFFDEDNEGTEADGTVAMTFDEWREFAEWWPLR